MKIIDCFLCQLKFGFRFCSGANTSSDTKGMSAWIAPIYSWNLLDYINDYCVASGTRSRAHPPRQNISNWWVELNFAHRFRACWRSSRVYCEYSWLYANEKETIHYRSRNFNAHRYDARLYYCAVLSFPTDLALNRRASNRCTAWLFITWNAGGDDGAL